MICDLRSDHNLDHLQVRTTWELWTLRHKKARVSDKKAPKTTQKETKDGYCFLWEHDVAGSNPVIPTKSTSSVLGWGCFYVRNDLRHFQKNAFLEG